MFSVNKVADIVARLFKLLIVQPEYRAGSFKTFFQHQNVSVAVVVPPERDRLFVVNSFNLVQGMKYHVYLFVFVFAVRYYGDLFERKFFPSASSKTIFPLLFSSRIMSEMSCYIFPATPFLNFIVLKVWLVCQYRFVVKLIVKHNAFALVFRTVIISCLSDKVNILNVYHYRFYTNITFRPSVPIYLIKY